MARRRQITADEQALWHSITRTVLPLHPRKPKNKNKNRKMPAAARATETASPPPVRLPAAVPSRPAPPPPRLPRPGPAPALEPLDRRSKQRLGRGTEVVDARLDLHGRSQAEAHAALLRFLTRSQADGARTVLVITGKGTGAGGERGVLRRQVPLWLALPEFRTLVVAYGTAGIGHGGDGALYVRVRRARARI